MTRILLPPVLARFRFGFNRAGRKRSESGSSNINGNICNISTPSWGSSLGAATAFGLVDVIYNNCLLQLSLRTCPLSRKLGISVSTLMNAHGESCTKACLWYAIAASSAQLVERLIRTEI